MAGCSQKASKFTVYFCPNTGTTLSPFLSLRDKSKKNQGGGKMESGRKIERTGLTEVVKEKLYIKEFITAFITA